MKRSVVIAVNTLLVLVIILVILATWMPAIYTSQWFQSNPWIKVHLLHDQTPDGKASGQQRGGGMAKPESLNE